MGTLDNVQLLFLAGYCSNGWRSRPARRRKFADGRKVPKLRSAWPATILGARQAKTAASFSLAAEC
jgi:hypothetical protein